MEIFMTKSELIKISKEDSFELGKKIYIIGHSIEYNPYRNLPMDKNIAMLEKSFIEGCNSAKKSSMITF
jgi:hypothetical protein